MKDWEDRRGKTFPGFQVWLGFKLAGRYIELDGVSTVHKEKGQYLCF